MARRLVRQAPGGLRALGPPPGEPSSRSRSWSAGGGGGGRPPFRARAVAIGVESASGRSRYPARKPGSGAAVARRVSSSGGSTCPCRRWREDGTRPVGFEEDGDVAPARGAGTPRRRAGSPAHGGPRGGRCGDAGPPRHALEPPRRTRRIGGGAAPPQQRDDDEDDHLHGSHSARAMERTSSAAWARPGSSPRAGYPGTTAGPPQPRPVARNPCEGLHGRVPRHVLGRARSPPRHGRRVQGKTVTAVAPLAVRRTARHPSLTNGGGRPASPSNTRRIGRCDGRFPGRGTARAQ